MWKPGNVCPCRGGWTFTIVSPQGRLLLSDEKFERAAEAKAAMREQVDRMNSR